MLANKNGLENDDFTLPSVENPFVYTYVTKRGTLMENGNVCKSLEWNLLDNVLFDLSECHSVSDMQSKAVQLV